MRKEVSIEPLTYSANEAAQVLGVSKPTLYKLIHQEGFPAFKLGGRTLISVEGLQEWVRQKTQLAYTPAQEEENHDPAYKRFSHDSR